MSLTVVILAAGKGTRMKSSIPKVLHRLAGKPLLGHVIDTARQLQADQICVVYGHGGEILPESFSEQADIHWVLQEPQLGTAHAVKQASKFIEASDTVLVLYGDVPLAPATILSELLSSVADKVMGLLTVTLAEPDGYGRVVRDSSNNVIAIVEQKDATTAQLKIKEGNTGIMALPAKQLVNWLQQIDNNNAQNEYYLTDVIALAVSNKVKIINKQVMAVEEVLGINSRQQLVELERYHQRKIATALAAEGVTIRDPERFDLRGELEIGQDVEIDINVIIEGNVTIGNQVLIEANCIIRDSSIGANTHIQANSVIENSQIGEACSIGPFARLRPETVLKDKAKVGNFVEIKKSVVGVGSKINHLSYVGDTTMGKNVNVGAGTITCNYDGANKHQTIIEDNVFVGSDTQLIAPVRVAKNATIGAGATITKDVPESALALTRCKQTNIAKWKRPLKGTRE